MSRDARLALALQLESAVWDALVAGDASVDEAALAEHFLGVYPTGFSDRAGHVGQLSDGPTVAEYSIVSPVRLDLGADCFLLAYDAHYRRIAGAPVERMYVSSVWQRIDGAWRNVFSQDTPASDTAVP